MFIEVHIAGELLHRWKIEDYYSCQIDGATWQQNVEAREKLAEMFLNHFLRFTAPLIATIGNAEYYLVFESKINYLQYEPDEDLPSLPEVPERKGISQSDIS